ncbi:MAG: alpha/beta hydrolase [Candidatus Heimdallarchaeota archaeon]|nr:alpha/beta hydrolase [Candidatus Heimdallarchaeota archaeon]
MRRENLEELFPNASSRETILIEMPDNAIVTVYKLQPKSKSKKEIVLIIPGFVASLKQWSTIIDGIVRRGYLVYIFETREKNSSTSKANDPRFNTEGLIADLTDVLMELKIPKPFAMAGNSLGSTIILKHIIDQKVKDLLPDKIALLQAVYVSTPLGRFIKLAKKPIQFRPIIIFVRMFAPILMRKQRKESPHFPHFYKRSVNRIRTANIEKLRVGLLSSVTLNILDDLPKVEVPALILGTNDDTIHPIQQAKTITERVKNGQYIDMIDDETLHSDKAAEVITNFLEKGK